MSLIQFNQQNVDTHISELQALPASSKRPIQDQMRQSFTGYLQSVFEFDQDYQQALSEFTAEENRMWGMTAATGIDTDNTLTVTVAPPPPAAKAKSKKKVTISAETDIKTGGTKVKGSMSWEWE